MGIPVAVIYSQEGQNSAAASGSGTGNEFLHILLFLFWNSYGMALKNCNNQESLRELPEELTNLQGMQYGLFTQLIIGNGQTAI